MNQKKNIKRFLLPLVLLLLVLIVEEATITGQVNYTCNTVPSFCMALPIVAYCIQLLMAPIQSGYSDYSRRRDLITAAFINVFSMAVFGLSFIWGKWFLAAGVVINSLWSNITPIARSAIVDVYGHFSFRFQLSLAICVRGLGSVIPLMISVFVKPYQLYFVVLMIAVLGVLLTFFFKDPEDTHRVKKKPKPQVEVKRLYTVFKDKLFLSKWLAYVLIAFSFLEMYHKFVVSNFSSHMKYVPLSLVVAFLIGTATLRFLKYKDSSMIKVGYTISFLGILGILLLSIMQNKSNLAINMANAVYAFGLAFFYPCLFSLAIRKDKGDAHGKVFGLIESGNTLAILVSFLAFKFLHVGWPDLYIIIIAFISYLLAGFFSYYTLKSHNGNVSVNT